MHKATFQLSMVEEDPTCPLIHQTHIFIIISLMIGHMGRIPYLPHAIWTASSLAKFRAHDRVQTQ